VDRIPEDNGNRRLDSGLDRLEEWSRAAGQVEKNAVYEALFAVLNGTAFRRYRILNDLERPHEFFVIVRDQLVVKVNFTSADTFGIVYIGAPTGPPGRNVDAYYEA
jgi:hypothetical protein